MRGVDWNELKVLPALARGGSFAGAARELELDISTVSRRLVSLEESLGATLLARGGRVFEWTAEGKVALYFANTMEQQALEAERTIKAAKTEIAGTVRISAPAGVVPLTKIMADMRKQYPQLVVELNAENHIVDLSKGEADIAIRFRKPTEQDLVCRRAVEVGWGVFAAKDYIAKHGMPASADDLSKHPLILYTRGKLGDIGPYSWLEKYSTAANSIARVDSSEGAAIAIKEANALGLSCYFIAATYPELVPVFSEPVTVSTGHLVYHESARNTACVWW